MITEKTENTNGQNTQKIRPSVVRVFFPARNRELSYLNDSFDLKEGDSVFVDGKIAGLRGFVTEINYSFKIKLSEYKKVIGKADTDIHGQFFPNKSYFITFNKDALPYEKAITWFKAADDETDTLTVYSETDAGIDLEMLDTLHADRASISGAEEILEQDMVAYVELNGNTGKAIVKGHSAAHEIYFRYDDNTVFDLCCDCFGKNLCRHTLAVLWFLKNLLEDIRKDFDEEHKYSEYFAAISQLEFMKIAINGSGKRCLEL